MMVDEEATAPAARARTEAAEKRILTRRLKRRQSKFPQGSVGRKTIGKNPNIDTESIARKNECNRCVKRPGVSVAAIDVGRERG